MELLTNTSEKMLTLKDVAILTDKSEGFIKSKIAKDELKKYDKWGKPLEDPVKYKGYFKLCDIKYVFHIEPDLKRLAIPHYNNNTHYEDKDVHPKEVVRIFPPNVYKKIENVRTNRFDVCIMTAKIATSELLVPFKYENNQSINNNLKETFRIIERASGLLTDNGSLLIYDIPRWLPYYAVHLAEKLVFKYWIAIRTFDIYEKKMFDPVSLGVLFMVKKNERFVINTVREPHKYCKYCKEILKDYGGKKHLMHQKGAALSDVWKFMKTDHHNISQLNEIPRPVLRRLINLTCTDKNRLLMLKLD
ncbi:MAG: hypothetical protein KKD29_07180 [Candidatus Omnitrophica bacterium]|nr:hypothetical protein [Candidatus Omnitrophota bacterium]MBU4488258.1 hypothetical protein [Candidatus Omnitrophota bacterium]